MSCGGGHLGFPIGLKNSDLIKDIPMIIPLQFEFSQFISFHNYQVRGHTSFLVFSSPGPKVQVNYCHHLASVVCCLSSVNFSHFKLLLRNHGGFPIGLKNSDLIKDIPMIIPLQFEFSQFISFREEDL
jgi:hypothetical protein